MKKTAIMTFHTAKNYGALLQAYALREYAASLGADARIIDYCPDNIRYKLLPRERSVKGKIRSLLVLPHIFEKRRKFRKFEEFAADNLILTDKYRSTEALYENSLQAELYITGSDQVFNPNRAVHKKEAYFLDFTEEQAVKISYAASFGVDRIDDKYKDEISKYLIKFNGLSVREKRGIEIISDLTGQTAVENADPTLLLRMEDWETVERQYKGLPEEYVLYYKLLGVGDNIAASVAKKLELPLVMVTDSPRNKAGADYVIRDAGPGEFLWLYRKAAFIVTNSFHGVAFSLIYKKQFLSCDRQKSTRIRALNLLENLDLRSKIFFTDAAFEMENVIDYDIIGKKLEELTKNSGKYLAGWINQ